MGEKETQGEERNPLANKRPLEGTTPASMLISGFRPPNLGGKIFLLFEPRSLWCCLTAALAGQYRDGISEFPG